MIKEYWIKLDAKQRYIVAFGAAFVLMALVFEFAVFPLLDAKAKMKKSMAAQSRKLEDMIRLDAELTAQEARISQIKSTLTSRGGDFTLFAYLDKKAIAAGVKGSVRQMNSLQGARSSSFEETLMDLKLEKITLKQLTDFLYQVESPAELIRIKRITVTKMKESPDYISVQLLMASYAPVAPRSGGQ